MLDQDTAAAIPAAPALESAIPPAGSAAGVPSGGLSQQVHATGLTDSTLTTIGEQKIDAPGAMFVGAQYFEIARKSKSAVRQFSCSDGLAVSEADEQASVAHFRGSDDEVNALMARLAERRVLLLSAGRGAGKLSAAIYLGMQLRLEQKCSNTTVLADSLGRDVRIDIRHLAERDKGLPGRLVIFRKPFGRADPAVTRLFETTDRAGWDQLTARLRQQNAFLVFTADPRDAAAFRDRAAAQGLLHELLPHSRKLLEEGLEERLEALDASGAAREPLVALRAGRDQLLATFRFTAALAEFVDFYVDHYRPGLGLDDAIARFHDSSGWLLQELERDFESWTFGFTLALAQCVRNANGISWLDFDRLHRRVRQWLRRDLNQRTAAPVEDDEPDVDEIHPALSEVPLLRRCRAEIVKDSSSLADVIQFRDGAPPERLWTVILERHRRALTTILPGLRDLAENGQDDLRSLRTLAAQILGRMGEVDPRLVVMTLVDRWVRSDKGRHHGVIGPLYEGVIGSGSPRYRELCLRHLRHVRMGAASGNVAGLHASLGAYSWIGDYELGVAMRELGEIAREHLSPMMADVQHLSQNLADLENKCREQAKEGEDVESLLLCHALLRDLIGSVFKQKSRTLLGMQASLVSLCLTAGPIPVFREMRAWIADGGWQMGMLLALMFLHENGIASELAGYRVEAGSANEGQASSCNPLLAAIAAGKSEARDMAGFLGDLYESLTTPNRMDAKLLEYCRDSLQEHLLDWIRDALPVPEYTAAIRNLLEALTRTNEGVLRDPLAHLFARREFNDPDMPKLRTFAASVSP